MSGKKNLDFLLFGYNGVNNTGSEAKLLTTIADLKAVVGDELGRLGKLTVMTQSLKNQKRYVKDPEIRLLEIGPRTLVWPWPLLRNRSHVLLLSEGSTFIDHFSSIFIWMFCYGAQVGKRRGQGVVAYANDCGHLKPRNQQILRNTMNNSVDLVMLRNPDAISRMKEYGVTKDIHLVADGAYMYPALSREYMEGVWKRLDLEPEKKAVIGLCPKEFFWWPVKIKFIGPREDLYNWPAYQTWTKEGRENSRKYVEQSARYADWCVENFDADMAIIAMEHMDAPPARRIYEAMKHKDRARLVLSDEYDVDEIVAVLSALRFQVTTRYHSTVLASPFGVPMIAVSSDTRLEAVFNELDAGKYFIDYVKHPNRYPEVENLYERLVEMTGELIKEEDAWRARIKEAHQGFLERALKIRTIFKDWLTEEFLPSKGL
jgi:polysaccharide pyruvyl transferase WcaK-like protein